MDYQDKKKFKKLQKKKEARRKKMILRRESNMKESQVQRMLDKMNYESRTKVRPMRTKRSEEKSEKS
tara:strand:- start:17 stop:217 length:201 start_codon:yes stop_codon:yes gene_type:complete